MRDLSHVRANFEKQASFYDELIPKLIPKYQEQNDLIPSLIPFAPEEKISALDLGCGTGILAYLLLTAYPRARVTAYDLAENMLKECEKKLSEFKGRTTFWKGDFARDDFGSGYDVILSGFSIHHLYSADKKNLFRRIFRSLNPGGVFFIQDIVLGQNPDLTERNHKTWREYMTAQGEDAERWFQKYREQDTPDSLEDQMEWLQAAGFNQVECYWRYINFAIFGGKK